MSAIETKPIFSTASKYSQLQMIICQQLTTNCALEKLGTM
jgi:hypothetical protein